MGEGAKRVTTGRPPAVPSFCALTLAIVRPFLSYASMAETATCSSAGSIATGGAALQHRPWRRLAALSSGLAAVERFLAHSGTDRAPWLAVAMGFGITLWFVLPGPWHWLAVIAGCLAVVAATLALLDGAGRYPFVRHAVVMVALAVGVGCAVVWARSSLVGAPPIARPMVAVVDARILERVDLPAEERVRLIIATREPGRERPLRVRVNLPAKFDSAQLAEGARVRMSVRLMPPAPPMLPGGYDFARAAWFQGISATGSVLGEVVVLEPADGSGALSRLKRSISRHVRGEISGSAGGIAAALMTGDRGAIDARDEEAMRDSGLSHLLSVSGLHVSAVVAAAYAITVGLLALWPWLALRVRLPLVSAAVAALAGIGYTWLTGAEVPTVRSCIGAVLVLLALAMGRDPLNVRMLAVGAFVVIVFWPEAIAGPSFQMSFGAVLAIVALHGAAPVRAFLAPRSEAWWQRALRRVAMLLLTGIVIEAALMPMGIFHFHKTGFYGALANVVAIPLTTFVTMPLLAFALLMDLVGAGGPAWWLAALSLDLLLAIAHHVAVLPGSVARVPAISGALFSLFVIGGLWIGLWRGQARFLGLVPIAIAFTALVFVRPADVVVSADGRHVGIAGEIDDGLLVLRDGSSDYARSNLTELTGMPGAVTQLADWPAARCTRDFCAIDLIREGRAWRLLVARSRDQVPERELAAACDRADIVIADRYLPRSCQPAFLKADRALLSRTGGIAIDLRRAAIKTVADGQGRHGWWSPPPPRKAHPRRPATVAPGMRNSQ